MSIGDRQAWLEERLARGRVRFDDLVRLAARDPIGTWGQLADRGRVTEAQVAEMLTAGIVAGVHHLGFARDVSMLASPRIDLPPGAVRLPPLRQLLWAVAAVAGDIDRSRSAGGEA